MEKRVRALIIEEDKILLIKRVKANLSYFVIPGGGVEAGESNEEALIRECREELGGRCSCERFDTREHTRG